MTQIPTRPENYTVVARRYRPTRFEELIGQSQVSTALSNAIKQDRIGHAYLFTGARGVGKTSTARIFAKCLNCQSTDAATVSPCAEPEICDICRSIETGEDVDVIEIDGASNNGVDNIRELRANANIRPSRARFKIYIIDEVHMLSKGAFNALLKTLEEPPGHVKFVFCTTEPDKIPITVRSRCQQFDFLPVQTADIRQRLREITANENVEADESALTLLAQRAKGSMRDSQSLLEQLLSFTAGSISVDDVHKLLGTADSSILFEIGEHLLSGQSSQVLLDIGRAIDAGVDAGQLTEQLLGLFRDVMACKVGCDAEVFLQVTLDDLQHVQRLADQVELDRILSLLQILDKTLVSMRLTPHGRTLLEMAAVRICHLDQAQGISDLIAALRTGKLDTGKLAAAITREPQALTDAPPTTASKKNVDDSTARVKNTSTAVPDVGRHSNLTADAADPLESPPPASNSPTANPVQIDRGNIDRVWRQALEAIDDSSAVMASEYDQLELVDGNRLVVTLHDTYKKESCSRPEKKQRFEAVLADLTGRSFRIDFQVNEITSKQPETKQPVQSRRSIIRQLHQHPMLNRAIEVFDVEIVDFKRIKPK